MKGVSPIFAAVLILLIAISLFGMAAVFVWDATETGKDIVYRQQEEQSEGIPLITSLEGNTIQIKGVGRSELKNPEFYVNDKRVDALGPAILHPGVVGEYELDSQQMAQFSGEVEIKVTTGDGEDFLTRIIRGMGLIFIAPFEFVVPEVVYALPGSDILFRDSTNTTDMMVISEPGNVGIGTSTPAEKLHVIGNILATGTVCDVNGCIGSGGGSGGGNVSGVTLHAAKMTQTAVQNIPSGGNGYEIRFDVENFDVGDIADVTNNRFVIERSGKYLITASIGLHNLGSGKGAWLRLLKNGAGVKWALSREDETIGIPGLSEVLDLAAGDVLTLHVYHNKGSSLSTFMNVEYQARMSVMELSKSSGGGGNGSSLWSESGSDIYYNSGEVGIGTATPTRELHVIGDIEASGSMYATAYYYTSDERLKRNINPVEGLSIIEKLEGVTFDFLDGETGAGLIAQDVQKVLPEAVSESDGLLSVNYAALMAPLIESVKELKKENDLLREELSALRQEVSLLRENAE